MGKLISDIENLIFNAIEVLFLVLRLFALLYFIIITYKHSCNQGEKKDNYTTLTFLFLGISIIAFLPYWMS